MSNMKRFFSMIVLFGVLNSDVVLAEQYEIVIHGMTCAFCVDGLQRNLEKRPDITAAEVSLKHKKVRITTSDESVDLEAIRQTVIDAGFTPVNIERLADVP